MLQLRGVLINSFKTKGGTNDDGSVYEPKDKIQLLGDIPQRDGGVRKDLIDLSVDDFSIYRDLVGSEIIVNIGAFASKNNIIFFVQKGTLPEPVSQG